MMHDDLKKTLSFFHFFTIAPKVHPIYVCVIDNNRESKEKKINNNGGYYVPFAWVT